MICEIMLVPVKASYI